MKKLLNIFWNPDLPEIDDYYEPWTYDYEKLIRRAAVSDPSRSPARARRSPARRSSSQWGPNWDDNLAGSAPERTHWTRDRRHPGAGQGSSTSRRS